MNKTKHSYTYGFLLYKWKKHKTVLKEMATAKDEQQVHNYSLKYLYNILRANNKLITIHLNIYITISSIILYLYYNK